MKALISYRDIHENSLENLFLNLIMWNIYGYVISADNVVFVLIILVSGSEDSNVYFYDLTRPKHTCVNKLQVCLPLRFLNG